MRIEHLTQTQPTTTARSEATIISRSTLRVNQRAYPSDHRGIIKDCLIVHGFDIGGRDGIWKGVVKRFDRKCLDGNPYKSYKNLRARVKRHKELSA